MDDRKHTCSLLLLPNQNSYHAQHERWCSCSLTKPWSTSRILTWVCNKCLGRVHLELQVPGEADEVHPSSEFSFAVSMNPQESCSSATVDLSPADEIFYHGHLLPLHFLSLSPRSSAESFTRQTNELNGEDSKILDTEREIEDTHLLKGEEKEKSPFLRMPRFGSKKKKKKFDVYKWYERMVKPILGSLRNRGEKQGKKDSPVNRLRFSGDLGMQRNKVMIPVSAPATMRSSPSNSGLLVASGKSTPVARNDGTMEELQAAVEAAIAHCKNSIADFFTGTESKTISPTPTTM